MRRFSHTTVLPVDAARVWEALQDPTTWEAIGGVDRITDVRRDREGRLMGYRFSSTIGRVSYAGVANTVRAEPGRLMEVEVASRDLDGSILIRLEPGEEDTKMSVTVQLRPKGLMAAMAFPAISAAVGRGLPANVEEFASRIVG
ncbi:MAG: hypothetical protein KatS3mg011_0791 [Acidimicrobiia bacterium]|nr:MAG: hypothetical protein KatS3mg011_0791 [Acidimicrobiia bacterium]